ncbi:MAG: LacI family DNA-binding transcriptional regulator [Lachnospiraceae bacterium]|nr:LacI family DNA-binding transcriptional regulator [Lachnospiraceae bacterium]
MRNTEIKGELQMKRVTIKEVAKAAGVSITTVSHTLSGGGAISQQTREHVMEVVERMHYVADFKGQNLKAKSTKVIGLFVKSLRGSYYGDLAQAIYEEGSNAGYGLNVFIASQSDKIMVDIMNGRIDGAIVLNDGITGKEEELLREHEIPVVFLDRESADYHMSSVIFDSFEDGRLAGEYLLNLGYKRFAHIYGEKNNYDSIERLRGFRYALEQAGVTIPEEYILQGDFDKETARCSVEAFIEESKYPMPEAVFASNDLSAFGCIEGLQAKGYRVPEDVSVIGCDDIELCEWYIPKLTTIHNSFSEQGRKAMQMLLTMIEGNGKGEIVKLSGRIVIRESCKAVFSVSQPE